MRRIAARDAAMTGADGALAGKVCLVTGATAGIGAVTAEELARRGATVCVAGRDPGRCAETVRSIRERTENPAVESYVADLSSQAEVRRLAEEFRARHPRLDVLVNNAGAMFLSRRESVDGVEMTLALNHLAYFLLTNLLLDPIKAAAPSRVVCVASDAHRWPGKIDFDDLQGRRRYRGLRAYGQSKLANILFAFELARRLEGTGVTSNVLHPGFVATRFFEGAGMTGPRGGLMKLLARLLAIRPEDGAATTIALAASPELAGVTGRYFERRKPARPARGAHDEEAARRLWDVSEELTRPKPS